MHTLMRSHGQRARDKEEVQVLSRHFGERVAADFVNAIVIVAEDGVVEGLGEGVAGGGAEDGVGAVGAGDWGLAGGE
jgi:hypothetical protein